MSLVWTLPKQEHKDTQMNYWIWDIEKLNKPGSLQRKAEWQNKITRHVMEEQGNISKQVRRGTIERVQVWRKQEEKNKLHNEILACSVLCACGNSQKSAGGESSGGTYGALETWRRRKEKMSKEKKRSLLCPLQSGPLRVTGAVHRGQRTSKQNWCHEWQLGRRFISMENRMRTESALWKMRYGSGRLPM